LPRTSEIATARYLIALGSNVRHARLGRPEAVLRAALTVLPGALEAAAPIIASAPLGPSRRRYANSAAMIVCELPPDDLLDQLQEIERQFGRKRRGQRWTARVLDLDIVLWSGGPWTSPRLTIPHVAFRQRRFVLQPASAIAASWRDPLTHLTLRQLNARLIRRLTKRGLLPR
jgi:2-amino-4-hydroxy-6-hydroxymethyldihydropteridine diphosphokinase